jgi:D-glycero-D-manno-heptose 1,7-bisphosphate phosphatase
MVNKAVFFDRDGVLTALVEKRAPWSMKEFHIHREALSALTLTQNLGFMNLVITNQPDVETGRLGYSELEMMHELMRNELPIDDIAFCTKRDTYRYKPEPGMVEELAAQHNVDIKKSWMVGDRWRDIVLAHKIGMPSILIVNNETQQDWPAEYSDIRADHVVMNVFDACLLIKRIEDDRNIL